MEKHPMKILVIEDDPQIVEVVTTVIQIRWPEAEVISTHLGKRGLELIAEESPSVVILDIGLPDISGYEVIKSIRLFSGVPLVILSSRDKEVDIVRGLELGADDYVTKPFRHMELISRVKTAMRRSPDAKAQQMKLGELRYDPAILEVFWKGKTIVLTHTEGDIFHLLMKNADHVVTYSSLAKAVWGNDYVGATEALKVHIRRMREKIEVDPDKARLILTRPSVGYYLQVDQESPD
jgi:two-component system, OmpR family, response regulator VicR